MRTPCLLHALGAIALALAGCETADGTEPRDARVWQGSDASVWQPLSIDAGAAPDGGACEMSLPPIDSAALPLCGSAATRACLVACPAGDQPCQLACYAADPAETCQDCVTLQAVACADTRGCHAEVSRFLCCNAAMCADGADPECTGTACDLELQALFGCLGSTAPSCGDYADPDWVGGCFPTDGGDAGVSTVDAGPDGGL